MRFPSLKLDDYGGNRNCGSEALGSDFSRVLPLCLDFLSSPYFEIQAFEG